MAPDRMAGPFVSECRRPALANWRNRLYNEKGNPIVQGRCRRLYAVQRPLFCGEGYRGKRG